MEVQNDFLAGGWIKIWLLTYDGYLLRYSQSLLPIMSIKVIAQHCKRVQTCWIIIGLHRFKIPTAMYEQKIWITILLRTLFISAGRSVSVYACFFYKCFLAITVCLFAWRFFLQLLRINARVKFRFKNVARILVKDCLKAKLRFRIAIQANNSLKLFLPSY